MMNKESNSVYCDVQGSHCKHFSWRSIFAGAFVAIGLTFLFNLLTTGLGLTLYTPNEQGAHILGWGALVWMVVGSYITMFVAGWVTGLQSAWGHKITVCKGFLLGFLTWSLYLVISLLILSHVAQSASLAFLKGAFMYVGAESNAAVVTQHTEVAVQTIHKMGLATLSTFIIVAVGAIGACVGACCGISHCRKCCPTTK